MPALERKWWTLIAVCVAMFMLLLDITVVNVALPDIQRSLHSSFADLQWVVDAYSLTLAAFLLTAGVIGDIFGRRLIFTIGLGVFSIASLVCGLSTTSLMLNLARGVQGIGGAIMFATSLALIANAFVGRDRGTAFGAYGAVIGIAVAVGPLVGGAITSTIGWRWIFFVNVPIGVVAIFITQTQMAESRDPHRRRVDFAGFASFSVALFLLVWALVRGNDVGWSNVKTVLPLTAAAVLLVAFVVVELRSKDAMLDLSLFKRPAMVGVSGVAFTLAASIFAMFLYLTLYIQDDLGYGPLQAGLRFLPITLMSFFVAPVAGRLTVRMRSRVLLGTGMVLVALGLALMATSTPTSGWLQLLPGFVVAGAGIGMVNPVLASAAISVVPPERSGMASGTNSTFRQVGLATGIAALGAIFQSQMESRTAAELSHTAAGRLVLAHDNGQLGAALASGQVHSAVQGMPAPLAAALTDAYHVAFSGTVNLLMIIGTVVAALGALGAFVLVRQRDFVIPSYGPPSGDGHAPDGPDEAVTEDVPTPARRAGGGARRRAGRAVTTTEARRAVLPDPKPGRPRDEQATRAILSAAQRQLDADGFGRMSLESVAAEAGVSRATVYRRFEGKADLVTTAVAERVTAATPVPTGDPRRDLVRLLRDFEERFGSDCLEVVGGLCGLREEPDAMELHRRRVVRPRTDYARRLLAQAKAEGDLASGTDIDLTLEMLIGAVLARRVMGTPPDPRWAARSVDAVFARPAPTRR